MLDILKSWINMILGIGILFTIIQLITPNTKLKKYIYSLIGIITVIVIANPVIKLINNINGNDLQNGIVNIINSSSSYSNTDYSNYIQVSQNTVKTNFEEKLANDVKEKLEEYVPNITSVTIVATDEYNIEEVYVELSESTGFDIISYISQTYDIDKSKIIINIGG